MRWHYAGVASDGPALEAVRNVLDLLPAGACLCRADGRLTYYSPQAAEIWGHAPALDDGAPRWCGAYRLRTVQGEPMAHETSWMARAVAERRPYRAARLQIERPDGGRRFALAYASPLLGADGSVHGGLNLLVDVTDQHLAAEAELERARRREEQRIALACDIRAGLDPLRRAAQELPGPAAGRTPSDILDRQLRHVTRLVDRLLNLEVDLDDAPA